MNDKINKLETEIQNEIWRLQLLDYVHESTYSNLNRMREQLKKLKNENKTIKQSS